MKKILAVLMSIVMLFSLAVVPATAADEADDEVTVAEVIDSVELTVELIKDTLIQVHNIVGSIMALLEKECPMCGELHEIVHEEGFEGDEVVDGEDELPELPEAPNTPVEPDASDVEDEV